MRMLAVLSCLCSSVALAQAADGGVPPWELVRVYGFVKPVFIASSGAVESNSQPTAVAITAAGNPVLATRPDDARLTFQVGQSRLGFRVNEAGTVRGKLEFDFVDISKASPTVASLPRLRVAIAEWHPSPDFWLVAGQDWDLVSPALPHGANLIGSNFYAGNSAFIREQVKVFWKPGPVELAAAVGLASPNALKDGPIELGLVPSAALRATWTPVKGVSLAASGLGTSLVLGLGTAQERRAFAGLAALTADLALGSTHLVAEGYVGQNAWNLGMLTLGAGNASTDAVDFGGFVSLKQKLGERHAVYGRTGFARVLTAVTPSYSYAAGSTTPTSTATTTGPGLSQNVASTVGYEFRVTPALGFLVEGFFLLSRHQLQEADARRFDDDRMAFGTEFGAMFNF